MIALETEESRDVEPGSFFKHWEQIAKSNSSSEDKRKQIDELAIAIAEELYT